MPALEVSGISLFKKKNIFNFLKAFDNLYKEYVVDVIE